MAQDLLASVRLALSVALAHLRVVPWGACCTYGALALLSVTFLMYLVPQLFLDLFCSRGQDLRKKYDAKWALVTGASTGIGKSLAMRLADQGLNVVLVALDQPVFDETFEEIQEAYPKQKFKKVATNLGAPGYMDDIRGATQRLDVQLVFNNAGYMLTGFFFDSPLDAQAANMECNATAAMQISHYFVGKMVARGVPGCVVFTSSAAAAMPSPFTVLYAATKSFLSSFGASLAAEVKSKGIDVCVIHPSPVASRFYDKAHKLDMLDFFKGFAVDPDSLPDIILGSVGRTVWRDIGATAVFFRLMMKVFDYNFLATLTANIAHTMADYKRHASKPKRGRRSSAARR
ncbi:unnamed protein product [Pedinophyceae sp. YPF-701]|nr:unnamed protein product [Pedinophyceae sp. YPF-701]